MSTSTHSYSSQSALLQKAVWICHRCASKLAERRASHEFNNYATCGICRHKTSVASQPAKRPLERLG